MATVDFNGQTIWIADAHRGDGQRFVVHADDKLTAFLELESAIRARAGRLAAAPWSDHSYPKPLVEEIKCLRDQM